MSETRSLQMQLMDCSDRLRYLRQHADAKLVAKAADRIDALEGALGGLLSYVERNTCQHDETHRGGALWEICDQCGTKWADDRGGKPKFKWHSDITNARAALSPPSDNSDAQAGSMK